MLLLDEPLGALDLKLREEMQVELKRIRATSDHLRLRDARPGREALSMSDRIAVFNRGRIEQVGARRRLTSALTEFVAGFVGVSNMLERDAGGSRIRPEGEDP